MLKTVSGTLAAVVGTLALAAAGLAATRTSSILCCTITIKSTGFSPASLTVNHGDRVAFKNSDKVDHQVVADDGSFASPILHANQSWATAVLNTAGTFRYHDALHPSLSGKLTVNGPPPAVTLALSVPIVDYGSQITLSGAVSSSAANEPVELDQQPWGQPSATQLAIVKTGAGGTYSFNVTPSIYTTFVARWKNVASSSVVAQVAPKIRLLRGGQGYMKAVVSSPVSLWNHHLYLQRLSQFGQWVNIAPLTLGQLNGRLFRPVSYLPKGVSHIRVFLSVNQAGNGLLAAHSGTQTVVRKR
jgi:plastocyanin